MLFPTTRVRSTVSHGHVRETGVKRVPLEANKPFGAWKYTRKEEFVYLDKGMTEHLLAS